MATDTRRDQPVRLPNPSAQPFVTALKTVRFFAVIFFWIAMVAMLAQVAAFVGTEWLRWYDEPAETAPEGEPRAGGLFFESVAAAEEVPDEDAEQEATGFVATPAETPEPVGAEEPEDEPMTPARRLEITRAVMRPLRVLGALASVLLWITTFLYLQIGLLGRLSGIRQITNAFFTLLVFLATALPWHYIFPDLEFGSFYTLDALLEAHAAGSAEAAPAAALACYWGRFFALPVLSVVLLAIAGVQFAGGYAESVVANE